MWMRITVGAETETAFLVQCPPEEARCLCRRVLSDLQWRVLSDDHGVLTATPQGGFFYGLMRTYEVLHKGCPDRVKFTFAAVESPTVSVVGVEYQQGRKAFRRLKTVLEENWNKLLSAFQSRATLERVAVIPMKDALGRLSQLAED